jgi:curli biogenesis system outer membrane secretion channel CsgG
MMEHKKIICRVASMVLLSGLSSNTLAQSGSAGGATSVDANPKLEYCDEPLGTVGVDEDQQATWWRSYYGRYPSLGSTVPVLRLMIQQSNCFVVVERGRSLNNVMVERDLEDSGELRQGSKFQKGQMVSADFTMSPSIQFSENTGGLGAMVGGYLKKKAPLLGGAVGKLKRKQAATTLLLIDNRSSVQVAASVGQAKRYNFGLGLAGFTRSAGGALGGYTSTPEGKIIVAAFADSYNNMVKALRNYKTQEIKSGLGKGGKLKVGG